MGKALKVLYRGAEAILYLGKHDGEKVLVKERIPKGYRIRELDGKLRKERTSSEIGFLDRAKRSGISVPRVIDSDGTKIMLEYIDGHRLKDIFDRMKKFQLIYVCKKIGESVAKLHSAHIMHGDLTTSNMILKGNILYFIDFSLAKHTKRIEDFSTDLFLLYESIKATHLIVLNEAWENIKEGYKTNPSWKEVFSQLENISKRRRYVDSNL